MEPLPDRRPTRYATLPSGGVAFAYPDSRYSLIHDPYLLRGKLRCAGCAGEVLPTQILGAPRRYACRSGCRMVPLLAGPLEARVWREVCRRDPGLSRVRATELRAGLIDGMFSRITVGGTVTDLVYVARTPDRVGDRARRLLAAGRGTG